MVHGIIGLAGSGKDTVADFLREAGYNKFAFADPMRLIASVINPIVSFAINGDPIRYNDAVAECGYQEAKDRYVEARNFLQKLGTEGGRGVLGEDVWVNATFSKIGDKPAVISDVRFPNEANAISNVYDGMLIVVYRPGIERINDHPSEDMAWRLSQDLGRWHEDKTYDLWNIEMLHDLGLNEDSRLIGIVNNGTLEDLKEKVSRVLMYHGD